MDLISLYQAQVKAISNLHCQKIICSANLDSSDVQPSPAELTIHAVDRLAALEVGRSE
jgi:hypothetical protein